MRTRFEEFEVDHEALELTRSGTPVSLSPMGVRVLLFLLERAGSLVPRDALYDAFWPEANVDRERLVNTYVRQIRAALGERAGDDRFIRTYPGRGYRFLPAVQRGLQPSLSSQPSLDPQPGLGPQPTPARSPGPPRSPSRVRRSPRRPVWVPLGSAILGAVVIAGLVMVGNGRSHQAVAEHELLSFQMGMELLAEPSVEVRAASVPHFREAVTLDPDLAPAHSGLAEGLFWARDLEGAKRAARRALDLDAENARAHLVMGSAMLDADWAWPEAEHHLRIAAAGDASHTEPLVALAYLLVTSGRDDEAKGVLDQAAALEPTSASVTGDLGMMYGWLGHHEQALELCTRTIVIREDAAWGHACALRAAHELEKWSEVRARIRSLVELEGADPDAVLKGARSADQIMAAWHHFQMDVGPPDSHFQKAVVLSFLGHRAEAAQALDAAAQAREPGVLLLATLPELRQLRGEPEYDALHERVFARLERARPKGDLSEEDRSAGPPSPGP